MTLLERVEAVLLSHGITPEHDSDDLVTYISTGLVGSKMRISELEGMLRCLISTPVFVPADRRFSIAETICRINWNLYGGAVEMDFEDGELRFRNSLPILDSEFTDTQLDWLVFWSWNIVRRYISALLEVVVGACEPGLAIAKVEMGGVEVDRVEMGGGRPLIN